MREREKSMCYRVYCFVCVLLKVSNREEGSHIWASIWIALPNQFWARIPEEEIHQTQVILF